MEEIGVATREMFHLGGLIITNTNIWIFIIATALVVSLVLTFSHARIIPGKMQNFFEWILETFLNFADSITGARSKTLEIFPLAMTIFLLVLCSNLLELIPGLGVFPVLRSPSSDLNFTIALALIAIGFINYSAMKN